MNLWLLFLRLIVVSPKVPPQATVVFQVFVSILPLDVCKPARWTRKISREPLILMLLLAASSEIITWMTFSRDPLWKRNVYPWQLLPQSWYEYITL